MQLHTPQSLARVHGLDVPQSERSLTAIALRSVLAGCAWIGRMFRAWHDRRKAMQDYQRLLAMPDYMLRDVGLSRHAIRGAMAKEALHWWSKW